MATTKTAQAYRDETARLENWFEAEVTRASNCAHNAMSRDPNPFFLYYRKGGLALFSDMEADEAVKAGWILATPEPFRPGLR